MCQPISGWAVRPIGDEPVRVFISDKTDSHEEIRSEFGIREAGHDGFANAAKFEFVPDCDAPSPDVATWVLLLDEATRPVWLDSAVEAAIRARFEEYARRFVFTEGHHETTVRGFYFGSSSGTVSGGVADFFENSSGTVSGGEANFYKKSSGTVSGGVANFYDTSSGTVSGGWAGFFDNSSGTVSGGEADFYGTSSGTVSVNGWAYFHGTSTRKEPTC